MTIEIITAQEKLRHATQRNATISD